MKLSNTQDNVLTKIMEQMKELFPDGFRLTLIARDSTQPKEKNKGVLIVTDDDLEKVQKALYEERIAHTTGITF